MKKILLILPLLFFFINVNADTSYSWTTKQSRLYYDQQGTINVYNWQSMPYTHSSPYPITQLEYRLKYSGGLSASNTYTFSIDFNPVPDAISVSGFYFTDGTNRLTDVNCSGWSRTSNGTYTNLCAVSPVVDISSNGYLYVNIYFNEDYLDTIQSGVGNFTITKGVGAVIQDSAIDIMNNTNQLLTNQCSNEWNYNNFGTSNVNNLVVNNKFDISYNGSGSNIKLSKDLNLSPNTTYYYSLNYNSSNSVAYMFGLWCIDSGGGWTEIFSKSFTGSNGSFNRTFTTPSTSCSYYRYEFNNNNVSTNTNFSYSNIMLSKYNVSYCQYGSSSNKIDDVNSSINDVNSSINDVNNSITDDSVDDPDSFISQITNMLATNGTITQLITLPITMFTSILNNINGTCSSFNVGNLLGTDLIFPCIDVSTYLGSTLWGVIDVICSGFFVLTIAKKMIKAFNNFSGMKEGDVINND